MITRVPWVGSAGREKSERVRWIKVVNLVGEFAVDSHVSTLPMFSSVVSIKTMGISAFNLSIVFHTLLESRE